MATVFLDIRLGPRDLGRIKIKLDTGVVPKTSENFRKFCTGEYRQNGQPIGYKGCIFHRVVQGKLIQGGDFLSNNGLGLMSIYGTVFEDESFALKHEKYAVSMANSGPDSNGCQFFICLLRMPELDGKNVVFGKVVEGFDIIDLIGKVKTESNGRPEINVSIAECGEM